MIILLVSNKANLKALSKDVSSASLTVFSPVFNQSADQIPQALSRAASLSDELRRRTYRDLTSEGLRAGLLIRGRAIPRRGTKVLHEQSDALIGGLGSPFERDSGAVDVIGAQLYYFRLFDLFMHLLSCICGSRTYYKFEPIKPYFGFMY